MGSRDTVEPAVMRFGEFELDEALCQLRYRGTVVPLEPKPFDLLRLLIRARERVVRREELMDALWPGVVVSETTLSAAVRRARAALAPCSDIIQGVRKVGYRFTAELDGVGQAAPVMSSRLPLPGLTTKEESSAAFIGRRDEMAELVASFDRAASGRGRFVALSGEAGIGKSRTVEGLTHVARERGAEVVVGRCYEGEGGQAFWPWIQVFREFSSHRDAAELNKVLATEAADISRLTAAVTATAEATSADPEMLRARLFDSAVAVLRRAARERPLVVVLDDLHWADRASTTLLLALVRQLTDVALLVIGTYRDIELDDEHFVSAMLSTARRERLLQVIPLRPLPANEAADLVRALAAAPVDDSIVESVCATAEGNPFFVHEYWRDLIEAGLVALGEGGWQRIAPAPAQAVPHGVVEIVKRRLHRLNSDCLQMLTIAAVAGREFRHDLLALISTTTPSATIDLLDQATAAHVIDEDRAVPGRYRFVHALFRATLYEEMTGLRRAALHRVVGEGLECLAPPVASREVVAELAHHFILGAPAGAADKAIDYAERAAEQATQACAYDAAVEYLDEAVRLADGLANPEGTLRRCELHLQHSEAIGRAGDGARMRACFEQAAALARALGEATMLARAAIGITSRWVADDEVGLRLLQESLSVLPATQVVLRAQVQSRLAKSLYLIDGTRVRRAQLCADARVTAAQSGDSRVLGNVLVDCLEALFHSDSLGEQDELATALCSAAEAAADARLRLMGQAWQIVNLMRRGQLNQAEQRLAEFLRLAGELRQPQFLHHAAVFDSALLLARGRLTEAAERSEEGLRLGSPIDRGSALWVHWLQLHHLRREQGRLAEFLGEGLALRTPSDTLGALFYRKSMRWAAPHVFCELGRDEDAKTVFDNLLAEGLDKLPGDDARNTRLAALFSLADACGTVGDEAAASHLYELTRPYADQWHVIGWGLVVYASTHLVLGVLAGVQRRWDDAAAHFEEALRQHDEQGAACAQPRALFQYARTLQRRGHKSDSAEARRLIKRGLEIAAKHGLEGAAIRLRRLT